MNRWPAEDYLNIWIVNKIENGVLAGYSPWPWYTDAVIMDGIVIDAGAVRPDAGTGAFSEAIAHEAGHSFGLYHTFQDGCPKTSCTTQGDEICDTEPQDFVAFSCDAGKINSCTGVTFAGVEHNLMNYTLCPDRFTKGQRQRVLFTLDNYRMGLAASLGTSAPDPAFVSPALACKPGIAIPGNTQDIGPRRIELNNLLTQSGGYNSDGNQAYLDRTCIQTAALVKQGLSYTLSVSTAQIENVRVWIDYNNDGRFCPCGTGAAS